MEVRASKDVQIVVVLALDARHTVEALERTCWMAIGEATGLFQSSGSDGLAIPVDPSRMVHVLPRITVWRTGPTSPDAPRSVLSEKDLRHLLLEASIDASTSSAMVD